MQITQIQVEEPFSPLGCAATKTFLSLTFIYLPSALVCAMLLGILVNALLSLDLQIVDHY